MHKIAPETNTAWNLILKMHFSTGIIRITYTYRCQPTCVGSSFPKCKQNKTEDIICAPRKKCDCLCHTSVV
jgi:hypothetical protein